MTVPNPQGAGTFKAGEFNDTLIRKISAQWNGAGSAVATSSYVLGSSEVAGTILGWTLYADTASTTTIDIWKVAAGSWPPTVTNTIVGTAYPTLTAATYAEAGLIFSGTATYKSLGWTNTTIAVGDGLIFNVKTNNDATILMCNLIIQTGS